MKNVVTAILLGLICSLLITWSATAEEISNDALNERITKLEEKIGDNGPGNSWMNRISIYGAIKAEAALVNGEDDDSSDISLSTVDVNLDVDIAKHVSGHVLFTYGDDEGMEVDEGFIKLDGKDAMPLYLMAGKIYVPFGKYETHMLTDPLTQDLGETVEGAVQVGFANDWIDVGLALYQGDSIIDDDDDDEITDYALGAQFTLPKNRIPAINLSAGLSFLSNIGDSNGMIDIQEELGNAPYEDKVMGMGIFLSVSVKKMIFFEAEYITALDEFNAGELDTDDEAAPQAWNLELACLPMKKLEVALRYAQAEDVENYLPETQYGLNAAYSLFENTDVSLEFLKNEYENDDEESIITAQLAIEF